MKNGERRATADVSVAMPASVGGSRELGRLGALRGRALQVGQQFMLVCPTLKIQPQHLEGSLVRLGAGPLDDQQTGDQGQVDLNGDAIVTGRQQMLAAEDALEPAEEKFDRPAILVAQGDPSGIEIDAVARQQQDFGATVAVGVAGGDLDNTERLLEDMAARFAAQPDDTVADDARLLGVVGEDAFLDEFEDGVVADAADEVRLGVDDVLEQLILGVTAIDDIEAIGLQGGAKFLFFVAVAVGDRGVTRYGFEDVEVEVELGGAMGVVKP